MKPIIVDASKHRPDVSRPGTGTPPQDLQAHRDDVLLARDTYAALRSNDEELARRREYAVQERIDDAVLSVRESITNEFLSPEGFEELLRSTYKRPRLKWLWVFVKHTELVTRIRRAYNVLRGRESFAG